MLLVFVFTRVAFYGMVLIIAGAFMRLWISKRRFDRRGVAGLQHYSSYWASLISSTVEFLLAIVSVLMVISGLGLLIVEWYNHG